jgi:hypothetical protein
MGSRSEDKGQRLEVEMIGGSETILEPFAVIA